MRFLVPLTAGLHVFTSASVPTLAARLRCEAAEPALRVGATGDSLHAYLDRLSRFGAFSGQVLVARHDSVLLHGGYGLADQHRCIPVRRATVFDIGSVAKQFAATAIMRLEAEGALRVTDSLARFFPDAPTAKRTITLQELLTHTSGMPGDFEGQGARVTTAGDPQLASMLLALPLESTPGSRYRYSNAGYSLLRLIVERASGMEYGLYVRQALLRPAGLTRTGWHGDSALWSAADVARGAWGLYDTGSPREWRNMGATFGGGEMVSSVGELYAWMRAMAQGRIISAPARARMLARPPNASGDPTAYYGYGWNVRTNEDGVPLLVFHNGIFNTFRTSLRHYLSDDTYVIVMTNFIPQGAGDRADVVANTLRDLMRTGEAEMPPPLPEQKAPAPSERARRLVIGTAQFRMLPLTADREWLVPDNQDAFDLAWTPNDARRALHAAVRSRTSALFDSVRATPCGDAHGGLEGLLCEMRREVGTVRDVQVIGAAPISWSSDASFVYVSVRGERASRAIVLQWRDTMLVDAYTDSSVVAPQGIPLVRLDARTHYLAYDPFANRAMRVTVVGRTVSITHP